MSGRFDLASEPHHDGSRRFVETRGQRIVLRLVVPQGLEVSEVAVRVVSGGQAIYMPADIRLHDDEGVWWYSELDARSTPLNYRFVLLGREYRYHFNSEGTHRSEPPDSADFRLQSGDGAPHWVRSRIAYYAFLDRFRRAGRGAMANLSAWSEPVAARYPENVLQFYGGDLLGLQEGLEHISALGANLLVISPFFPAPESHRYCATTFSEVDPLVGGDVALSDLTFSAHQIDVRCLGDLTLNHTGSRHTWFQRALEDPASPERRMYAINPDNSYETYQGVPSLPRLDYRSRETRRRMYESPESAVRRWLRPPFDLDGWRFDVAAMVGRLRGDMNAEVADGVQAAMREEAGDDFFQIAEILHDPSTDLSDERWHGSLLDAGFCSPVRKFVGSRVGVDRYSGVELYSALRSFASRLSWQTLADSVAFVGSHDLPRLRSIVASDAAFLQAYFLLLTFPSVPMIYGGDEFVMEGITSDLGRGPLPWGTFDRFPLLETFGFLVRLRRHQEALSDGGLRWLAFSEEMICYERATSDAALVCAVARGAGRWSISAPTQSPELAEIFSIGSSMSSGGGLLEYRASRPWAFGIWRLSKG